LGTYDHKQVLLSTLQHIDKLYDLQTTANINRYDLRGKVDTLEDKLDAAQTEIARLAAYIEKFLPKTSGQSSPEQP